MTLLREIILLFVELAPVLLLGFLVSGIMSELLPEESIMNHLGDKNKFPEIKASLLGVPLPLCSCAVIPTALSLKKLGANNAALVSFLTSTPQTGLDSFIVTYRFLGPVMAIFKPIAAFFMGVSGGYLVRWFGNNSVPEKSLIPSSSPCCCHCGKENKIKKNWKEKIKAIFYFGFITSLEDISTWLILGIILAGLISWLIPDDFFIHYLNNDFQSMLLMVIVGVPLYICVTASIPIACALIGKGISPGAAFVFLTTGAATNLASILVLFKIIGKRNTLLYLLNVVAGSVLMGIVLNSISILFPIHAFQATRHVHVSQFSPSQILFSIIFAALLIRPYLKKGYGSLFKKKG